MPDAQLHVFDKANHFVWLDQWRDFNSFGDMVSDEGLSPPVLRNAEQGREGVKRRLKTGRHSKRWEIEPLNVEGKI
jgi:hypothetical protein